MDQAVKDKLEAILARGLCGGKGRDPEGPVCIEQAISIATGEPFTSDAPSCVHPAVRAHAIALNDCSLWSSPKVRADSLREYALNQLGCTRIDGVEFVKRLALENIRQIVPVALRVTASLEFFAGAMREQLLAAASQCEQAPDLDTAATAARAARAARTAYTTAARAAYTTADAADTAADAAYTAAYTAADTADTAAATAARAARAARAADAADTAADAAYTAAYTAADTADTAAATAARAARAARAAYTTADTAGTAARAADTVLALEAKIASTILSDLMKEQS